MPDDHPICHASNVVLSANRTGSIVGDSHLIGRMVVDDLEAMTQGWPPWQMQPLEPKTVARLPQSGLAKVHWTSARRRLCGVAPVTVRTFVVTRCLAAHTPLRTATTTGRASSDEIANPAVTPSAARPIPSPDRHEIAPDWRGNMKSSCDQSLNPDCGWRAPAEGATSLASELTFGSTHCSALFGDRVSQHHVPCQSFRH